MELYAHNRIPEDAHRRVEAFAAVYRAVMDKDADVSKCLAVIVERGFQAALSDILRNQDQAVLIESIRQLASKHLKAVCRYMADMIGLGADTRKPKSRINTCVRITPANIAMEPTARADRSAPRLIANVRPR